MLLFSLVCQVLLIDAPPMSMPCGIMYSGSRDTCYNPHWCLPLLVNVTWEKYDPGKEYLQYSACSMDKWLSCSGWRYDTYLLQGDS